MDTKNVLVTGGAGFIGSHLTKKLVKEGHNVTILDDFSNGDLRNVWSLLTEKKIKMIRGDILDLRLIEDITHDIDIVYHLAAQIHIDKSILEPKRTFDVNAIGTLNILEVAMKRNFERVIYASTSEVYGTAQTEKMNEDHPLNPQSPYAASKLAADRLCHAYAETYGMSVSVIRNFNTYGPFQKHTGYGAVIPIFIRRVLNNKPPIIYGDGNQTRDFMYIEDAVNAYMLVTKKNPKEIVLNFGSGKDIKISDLARLIIKECGKEGELQPVQMEGRAGEVRKLCCDITRSKNALGFTPHYDINSGIKAFVEWFKKYNFDEWKIG
jgi:UDP-glucose 4-epimerase